MSYIRFLSFYAINEIINSKKNLRFQNLLHIVLYESQDDLSVLFIAGQSAVECRTVVLRPDLSVILDYTCKESVE